ncbi:hypothetical protein GC175_18090 [bacterium]|nr:hypothetical protein [bacterium]
MTSLPRLLWRPSRNTFEFSVQQPTARVSARLSRSLSASPEMQGKVHNLGFKIWRKRDYAQNKGTFAPILYGVIVPEGKGSRLVAHFQLNPVMRLFLIVWFGGSAIIALLFLFTAIQQATPESQVIDALPFLIPSILPLLGWLILMVQQRRGREDERMIRSWIEDVVRSA